MIHEQLWGACSAHNLDNTWTRFELLIFTPASLIHISTWKRGYAQLLPIYFDPIFCIPIQLTAALLLRVSIVGQRKATSSGMMHSDN